MTSSGLAPAPLVVATDDRVLLGADARSPTFSPSSRCDVAFFVHSLHGGGAERVIAHLANAWVDAHDARVAVITETAPETDQYRLDPRVTRLATLTAEPGRNAPQKAFNYAKKVVRLRQELARLRLPTLISFLCRNNIIAALATLGTPTRLIVSERNDPRYNRENGPDRLLRPLLYKRADCVVAQTEAIANVLRRDFGLRNVVVVPNPVSDNDRQDGAPTTERTKPYILGLGRLVPQKGFDLLIDAYARAKAHTCFDLVIAGKGPDHAQLQDQIASHGLQDKVFLLGHQADPSGLMDQCSVFALSSRYEGFPNVLLEAMAAGRPAVTFDFPSGASEMVHHNCDGLIVPMGDVSAFAIALDRLAFDRSLAGRLGDQARRSVRRFSTKVVLAQWRALVIGGTG